MAEDITTEDHRLFMLHDAWMRIMDPEQVSGVKTLYLLGYYWALVQMDLGSKALSESRFEDIMQGSHIRFHTAISQYLEGLPNE